jgi:hypothetical protein
MPAAEYEHRTDSVLAWKKAQKLGRFDPDAPSIEQQKVRASEREVEERGKQYFVLGYLSVKTVRLWQKLGSRSNPNVSNRAHHVLVIIRGCINGLPR